MFKTKCLKVEMTKEARMANRNLAVIMLRVQLQATKGVK